MDYKKKYEEALEQARIYYDTESNTNVFLDCIFPELAESDDERIRKWLVELVQNTDTNHNNMKLSENCKLAIAWLEKQKPADDIESATYNYADNLAGDYDDGIYSDIVEAYKAGAYYMDLKQKEQKPADTDLADEIDKVSKQYPEVSFAKLSRIAKHFYDFGKPATPIVVEDTHRFCDDTLEAIGKDIEMREQHPELYPAEWSEEDNAFLKVAIAICNRYSHKDIANWLKSLRPSWKPSEEQMNALAHAINLDVYDAKRYGLDSLYNDLNKLREG